VRAVGIAGLAASCQRQKQTQGLEPVLSDKALNGRDVLLLEGERGGGGVFGVGGDS
jgi:hypothetical protein